MRRVEMLEIEERGELSQTLNYQISDRTRGGKKGSLVNTKYPFEVGGASFT